MPRKILIADDEPNIVASLQFLMRQAGYECCVATNGDEVLVLLESFRPDLVLLDVMMPARSGYEVCRLIRAHPAWRHIKVLMLSARGREAEIREGLTAGADAYVSKPFSNRELVGIVHGLLGDSPGPVE